MPKNLILKKHKTDSAQEAMQFSVKLDVLLAEPVYIRFISINRQDTAMIIIHKDDKLEKTVKYPLGISYENTLIHKQLVPLLELLGIFLSSSDKDELIRLANNCLHKCESRFGLHVKNFDEVGCSDAVITLRGENGKSKRTVTFMDDLSELTVEDLDIDSRIEGEAELVDKHIVWTFDKDSISLEELIINLQGEFENPYIIIDPYQNLILDLRMQTTKYDNVIETIKKISGDKNEIK